MGTLHNPEHNLHSGKNFNKHHGPYWKRMHHDWRFWVSMVLVMVALSIYTMSVDFTIQPTTTQEAK
ncbi:MAG: hypothetical protein ACYDCN_07295 [Bacteroidia bacterium]